MMHEEWKAIIGLEGLYEVSNYGRVRSLDRVTEQENNGGRAKTRYNGKILRGNADKQGYVRVHCSKNGKGFTVLVHRAVAEAFCHKPDSCDIVNHIDNNPSNNHATNLEWTTYKGNMQWAAKQGRMHWQPDNLKKAVEALERPVIATDKTGHEYYFKSQAEAARILGIKSARGHIAACCRNDYGYKTAGGYSWRYAE